MSNNVSTSESSMFVPLLAVLFITLKLLGKIDWPWIWVLAPVWLPISIVIAVMLLTLLGVVIGHLSRRRRR